MHIFFLRLNIYVYNWWCILYKKILEICNIIEKSEENYYRGKGEFITDWETIIILLIFYNPLIISKKLLIIFYFPIILTLKHWITLNHTISYVLVFMSFLIVLWIKVSQKLNRSASLNNLINLIYFRL